ncbi:MotA/TolQ/ExbB proton channel family protein [Luteolibacter yonseiensis]|uniref:MotA/TolQ/ExbB proton channel family protein n=1 Tax=Luteolibacter yonseiensis TaxID=1144680 RepID=A0A934R610_9BACT|nr:MotA/TolQ/ExbB proton channel family protein [Luteolibacter yonseiensis]MBK1815890.1 MotA/TolQ/ExbB proton channel family protein [Luteolibacter yonseiensis]
MIQAITLLAAIPGFDSVWGFFQKGGIFMIPLGITCIAGLMAIVYKFLSLGGDRVIPVGLAREIATLDPDTSTAAIREFQEGKSTLARLGAVAVKHRGKPGAKITAAIEAAAREETVHLHSGIGILDIVITIAPLLGLVGTASGLVVIFEGLGDTSDHTVISRGIAEALSTTIFGIAIAVPAVIAHGYFHRKIEKLTARLESLLADLTRAVERPERP